MRRAFRLLVGAVIAIWLMGQFAIGLRWLYENYGRESESGVLHLLEYLFPEEEEPEPPAQGAPGQVPAAPGPLGEGEIEACARSGSAVARALLPACERIRLSRASSAAPGTAVPLA